MAVFEKDRGSRRYYSTSGDALPQSPGGIPTGSILTYTDTGDRFIYDGTLWLPFEGVEDTNEVLEQIGDTLVDLLRHIEMIRLTNVALANEIPDGEKFNPTDDR
ncbi:hypothetical protein LCGC14_2555800 [marine sediment metagenome]|uniref:Uncharacterized protein n=1 Tax=marine sediment metagenome TaxID=412755 RepID=A0A0F9ALG4_9ZZZZ